MENDQDQVKTALGRAVRGGDTTGVGRLKAPFLTGELGETGTGVLSTIRKALDPAGIMNPKGLTS